MGGVSQTLFPHSFCHTTNTSSSVALALPSEPQLPNEKIHLQQVNICLCAPSSLLELLLLSKAVQLSLSLVQSFSFCQSQLRWPNWCMCVYVSVCMSLCVCVWPQVPDDSSSGGHRGIYGNSEPAPRGSRQEEEEHEEDDFLSGIKGYLYPLLALCQLNWLGLSVWKKRLKRVCVCVCPCLITQGYRKDFYYWLKAKLKRIQYISSG